MIRHRIEELLEERLGFSPIFSTSLPTAIVHSAMCLCVIESDMEFRGMSAETSHSIGILDAAHAETTRVTVVVVQ
jgi:hypothetical protein